MTELWVFKFTISHVYQKTKDVDITIRQKIHSLSLSFSSKLRIYVHLQISLRRPFASDVTVSEDDFSDDEDEHGEEIYTDNDEDNRETQHQQQTPPIIPEVWGVSYHTESHEDVEVLEKFEGMIIGGKKCIETGVSKKRVEVATEERDAMLAILREEKNF